MWVSQYEKYGKKFVFFSYLEERNVKIVKLVDIAKYKE